MIRPIVAYGNPILNQPSSKVDIQNEDISNLIVDLWETMYNAAGVGLAAPQVNKPIQLFLVDTKANRLMAHTPVLIGARASYTIFSGISR